jgi:flavodoxin
MKILIAYYSKTGNTERAAKDLASQLGADLEKVIDRKNRKGILGYIFGGRDGMQKKETEIDNPSKNVTDYDLIIIGTPIWGWNMTPAVRTYLKKVRKDLKKVAFFTTSGSTDPEKIVGFVEEITDRKIIAYTGFSAKELINKEVYNRKIFDFVKKLSEIRN